MESKVITGFDMTERIRDLCAREDAFVVTDANVALSYASLFDMNRTHVVPAGEDSKSLAVYEQVAHAMLGAGCNRMSTLVAVGGGVVGDLTGFVAATYMRGIRWINVPTTLLAQVDSSVGGKTAVDLGDFKNILGAFHLPKEVLVSTHFLYTLPEREWLCGVGEIVKTMFLSRRVHDALSGRLDRLLSRDESVLSECVRECIEYKKHIVEQDFYEHGPRKALNLGHTIGHALEKTDKHRLSHGEYVLIGLEVEAYLLRDMLDEDIYDEMTECVSACNVTVPDFSCEEVASACLKDKKNTGGDVSFMLADYEETREVKLSLEEIVRGLMLWKLSR